MRNANRPQRTTTKWCKMQNNLTETQRQQRHKTTTKRYKTQNWLKRDENNHKERLKDPPARVYWEVPRT